MSAFAWSEQDPGRRLACRAAALSLALLLAACGSTPGPTASTSPARSATPGSTPAPGGASLVPSASAPASAAAGSSLDAGSDVAADQTLLSFVPASGGDLQVSYD